MRLNRVPHVHTHTHTHVHAHTHTYTLHERRGGKDGQRQAYQEPGRLGEGSSLPTRPLQWASGLGAQPGVRSPVH